MKLSIIAHPNSKRSRIETDLFGTTHVYINAPPLEGKANKAIIEMLAINFGVKSKNVILTKGQKSKNKTFEII